MTTQVLTLPPGAGFWRKLWHYALAIPFVTVRNYFALFLITTGTLYASAEFSQQHGIFPYWVAVPLAVGIEWTYLSGLAYATELRSSRWSIGMIVVGALTSGLFGYLYILGVYKVIPAVPDDTTARWLAAAHIVPLIALLVLYTLCKRGFATEQREYTDRQRVREETWRDARLEIEIERDRLALEKERIRVSRLSQKDTFVDTVSKVSPLAQKQHSDDLRLSIATLYKTLGDSLNVTAEARRLGISRSLWYKLRDDARARGELNTH